MSEQDEEETQTHTQTRKPIQTKKPITLAEYEKRDETTDLEEEDDTTVPVIFRMPKKTYRKLGQIALDRETSRVALVREAITEHFKKLEQPAEQNPKIADRQLDRILKECSEHKDFEIEGENGFIAKMQTKGFNLKDLTPEQWKKVTEKLQIGYNAYFSPPSPEEFAEKFESLEPTEEQKEWFSGTEEGKREGRKV